MTAAPRALAGIGGIGGIGHRGHACAGDPACSAPTVDISYRF